MTKDRELYSYYDLGYGVEIVRNTDGFSCFLQGDDADNFLEEMESIEDEAMYDVIMSAYDDIMELEED